MDGSLVSNVFIGTHSTFDAFNLNACFRGYLRVARQRDWLLVALCGDSDAFVAYLWQALRCKHLLKLCHLLLILFFTLFERAELFAQTRDILLRSLKILHAACLGRDVRI